jgi:hypothetical protein
VTLKVVLLGNVGGRKAGGICVRCLFSLGIDVEYLAIIFNPNNQSPHYNKEIYNPRHLCLIEAPLLTKHVATDTESRPWLMNSGRLGNDERLRKNEVRGLEICWAGQVQH